MTKSFNSDLNSNTILILNDLMARESINQNDVIEALDKLSNVERFNLWMLTQNKLVNTSSRVLLEAWNVYGINATVRVLANRLLEYKSAPDELKKILQEKRMLEFIEKTLSIKLGKLPQLNGRYMR